MTEPILHPSITEMLKDMEKVFTGFGIDYYVVGAVARDSKRMQRKLILINQNSSEANFTDPFYVYDYFILDKLPAIRDNLI